MHLVLQAIRSYFPYLDGNLFPGHQEEDWAHHPDSLKSPGENEIKAENKAISMNQNHTGQTFFNATKSKNTRVYELYMCTSVSACIHFLEL